MRLESVMTLMLEQQISDLFNNPPEHGYTSEHFSIFERFKLALNTGEVRAASPVGGSWKVNLWVKQGILLGFRMGTLIDYSIDGRFRFFDKHTFPLRQITVEDGVRVVPGGSRHGGHGTGGEGRNAVGTRPKTPTANGSSVINHYAPDA